MKKYVFIVFAVCCMVTGCKNSSTESINTALISDYFPFKTGNTWTYAITTVSNSSNTASFDTGTVSVVQTNTLIGGQPNALVLKIAGSAGEGTNMACYNSDKTLYAYLGETGVFAVPNVLFWYGGAINGATVAPGQSKTYAVFDSAYNHISFFIKRAPASAITAVAVVNSDSLRITGIAVGSTSLVLQKTGGTANDTMVVLIDVKSGGRMVAPPIASWMPLWQVVGSSEESMFSWDTLYSFRLRRDSSLCTDNISYSATCRFIDVETVQALGTSVSAEKFITTISVTERIMHAGLLLYDGPSTKYTMTLWLVKGIGIVQVGFSGNSLASGVLVEGTYDAVGVLHGLFVSPRLAYGSLETTSGVYTDYFYVNSTVLADPTSYTNATLRAKNF
jgi:hypothetical protein